MHRAKKHFGQNFLHEESYLYQIVESIPKDVIGKVIEIGPGLGDLTNKLLSFWDVLAFEVDKDLRLPLERKFQKELASGRLEIHFVDVMQEWKREGLHDQPYVLVSNLPYYIATWIVLKALKDPMCRACVVMVQKEVAQKFCAKSGASDFSALSVIAESCGFPELLFEVPPTAFNPPPKVTSAVFRVIKHDLLVDLSELEALLRLAFASPRKKALKNLALAYSDESLKGAFDLLGIKEGARPHELQTSHYHRLLKILNKGGNERNGEPRQQK